ncbi:transcription factor IIIA-like [Gastrolobium bilobum]|uniref:transcription factor IIIA-like n=1 Tax=Gastrolobium bilobum TaxID=150636 RepID=UPI002AB03D1F|nr:transcription factor IIIA-like [Gastrolobium bilobum]
MDVSVESEERPKFRDIRRYFCKYCGVCRSKKTLITSHINSNHKEEVEKTGVEIDPEVEGVKSNTCEECGASFKKHAYLLQHMLCHSFERPYVCTVNDCQASYRRKDHLTRHSLQHQGKTFKCPIENCNLDFSILSNMKRHVSELHDDSSTTSTSVQSQKQYVCPEIGCGKVFRFESKLRKHEDSHVKLESVDVVCLEPGCMKHFTNAQCLKAHINSCHQYVTCDTCGTKQLKKNIKRHLRTHEAGTSSEAFQCEFKGCGCTFSTKSNLRKHEKAVHFQKKPFVCCFPECGMSFAYKHVRDNHEKTGKHVYTLGDFEAADEEFRSRSRGGMKRKCPTVEMFVRKRVTPPSQLENWLLMLDTD